MARAPVGAILQYLRKLTASPADGETDRHLVQQFAAARDEAAFSAILRRHGGMVFGVCRRALADAHEAEDAFQATFLVFANKAGSLRRPELLGNWLYGVAQRVAAKARVGAARRRLREARLTEVAAPSTDDSAEKLELYRAVNEAIGRLPDKYRAPVVLCYLEGKTYTEAARVLGWAEGTVSGRLSRARDILRRWLDRSAAPASIGLLALSSSEAIRNELTKSLTTAALQAAAGQNTAGVVSAHAVALAKGVLKEMFWSKMKLALAVILMLGATGAGVVAIGYGRAPAPDESKPQANKSVVRNVTLKEPDIDDVASILHIYKESGTVHLSGPIKKAGLKFEFYKAGQLVKQQPIIDPVPVLFDVAVFGTQLEGAQFSLQIADLDYLPLEGSKKGFSRFQVNLQFVLAGSMMTARGVTTSLSGGGTFTTDVPKEIFDVNLLGHSASTFGGEAGSATEIPLFYVLANSKGADYAKTVADLVAKNDNADILIVSLLTTK